MSDKKFLISGACPHCGTQLYLPAEESAAFCPICHRGVGREQLAVAAHTGGADTAAGERRLADNVTSAASGLVYLDNLTSRIDWVEFAHNAHLSVPALSALAEAAELKFSDDPLTYLLAFRCLAIPAVKKVDGLTVLEVQIVDNYKSDDVSDAFEYTDLYAAITSRICSEREALVAALAAYVERAAGFGLSEELLEDMRRSLDICEAKLYSVQAVSGIEDIASYRTARELRDGQVAALLSERGIDARGTYDEAMALLADGRTEAALHSLLAIRGYRDADKLIEEHTSVFSFNGELIEMDGRCYYAKRGVAYFNPRTAGEDGAEEEREVCSLYEIHGDTASASPALTGITELIQCFGSRIFFIRQDTALAVLEMNGTAADGGRVGILDEAPRGDYVTADGAVLVSADRSRFIVKKKLREAPETKRGCFRRRKPTATVNRQNNYSVLLVDMNTVSASVILPEVIDIMDFVGDRIFYTTATENGTSFRVYSLESGEDRAILNSACIINAVSGGKIVYSRWAPTKFNLNLFSFDTESGKTDLIALNVHKVLAVEDGRVYYTVGTDTHSALRCAHLDGTGACELAQNCAEIVRISSGWVYYTRRGSWPNTALMKVRTDGSDEKLIATCFESLVKLQGGYIYYRTPTGKLVSVRTDGEGERVIASDVARDGIIVDADRIYYLRADVVADPTDKSDGMGLSLFSTSHSGDDLVKIAHDVVTVSEQGSDAIYLCRRCECTYKITTPTSKTEDKTETVVRTVTVYERFDKRTGRCRTVLRLGVPTPESFSYKAGCFLRPKYLSRVGTVSEISHDYVREGVAHKGAILAEEEREREAREAAAAAAAESAVTEEGTNE